MENVPQPDVVEKAISIPEQPEPSKEEVATLIADTLREMEEGARKDILHIVRAVGRTAARELLATTLQTQEQGGILLPDSQLYRVPMRSFSTWLTQLQEPRMESLYIPIATGNQGKTNQPPNSRLSPPCRKSP